MSQEVMKQLPEDRVLLLRVAQGFAEAKQFPEACAVCEKAITVSKTNKGKTSDLRFAAGIAARGGDWAKAIAFTERILEMPEVGNSHERAIKRIQQYAKKIEEGKARQ